jgi:hypothetical protein
MTETITTSLVGAHFRPPAKALLAVLPTGHPLFLRPEPTNEYDSNAVQVALRTAVLSQEEWHLGYLPRAAKGNKALEEWNVQVQQAVHEVCLAPHEGDRIEVDDDGHEDSVVYTYDRDEPLTIACSLSFDASGKPTVIIPWPPSSEDPSHIST